MSMVIQTLAGVVLAYLIGAAPFALMLGKMNGVDIRTKGSGNVGATNLTRNVGKSWGAACFILDFLKGFLPTLLFPRAFTEAHPALGVLCAVAAVAGHVYPVYLRFKGGKGVSTTLGALLALSAVPVLIAMAVWAIVFKTSRYVSVASLSAAAALPAAALFCRGDAWTKWAFLGLAILIIYRHRSNITALRNGTENRFSRKRQS
ncbi:MAG: glycerol-3-phosphate 1-O-acyltransferase PlsY [Lentisphaeria bacterium]|nr:glycerol-3-phosphate 1-O-acyltransferase PlsY [Lentisphaeria bacterium]